MMRYPLCAKRFSVLCAIFAILMLLMSTSFAFAEETREWWERMDTTSLSFRISRVALFGADMKAPQPKVLENVYRDSLVADPSLEAKLETPCLGRLEDLVRRIDERVGRERSQARYFPSDEEVMFPRMAVGAALGAMTPIVVRLVRYSGLRGLRAWSGPMESSMKIGGVAALGTLLGIFSTIPSLSSRDRERLNQRRSLEAWDAIYKKAHDALDLLREARMISQGKWSTGARFEEMFKSPEHDPGKRAKILDSARRIAQRDLSGEMCQADVFETAYLVIERAEQDRRAERIRVERSQAVSDRKRKGSREAIVKTPPKQDAELAL